MTSPPLLRRLSAPALRALIGLLIATFTGLALAGPPLWEVRDDQGRLRAHLFGTVHLCRSDCYPLPDVVRAAFERSQVVAFELDTTDPALTTALAAAGMLPEHRTLGDVVPADLYAEVRAAVAQLGLPGEALERMRPWFVANWLTVAAADQAGYRTDHGVETVLNARARAAGKPVVALETVDRQIAALSSGGEAAHDLALRQTLGLVRDGRMSAYLRRVASAWRQGDDDALMAAMVEGLEAPAAEALLQELIFTRNGEMARRIDAMLAHPGRLFVAVGGAHMIGASGIPAELARMGWGVERIDP